MSDIPAASRAAALARLAAFAPRMGQAYAAGRNHDPGPGARRDVSGLSPHIRHRLVTEQEVVAAALARHGPEAAGKFIQEVFWRTYWKGWLEQRPAVWDRYCAGRDAALAAPPQGYAEALAGRTGIACFDAWLRELTESGWLHNHARMWFASIWIFTLRLPWELGADLFLRHLLDADAASNTLSWRWVAGLQTRGKHYVARAENIARFTGGRFDPRGQLEENPVPLDDGPPPPARCRPRRRRPRARPCCCCMRTTCIPKACRSAPRASWPWPAARRPRRAPPLGCAPAARAGARAVLMPWAPVGWTARALAPLRASLAARGIALHVLRREWDSLCWPHATRCFFAFREHIPALCAALVRAPGAA
jgi:deoxyribodipyrimidine photo-lyase